MKIKHVTQEDTLGCGIAVLAMVTGRTYEEVYADFAQDVGTQGLSLEQIIEYSGNAGFSIIHKYVTHFADIKFGRDEIFSPFAPVHIVRLKQYFDANIGHVIVMDKDGKFFCPSNQSEEEIRNSYAITDVLGLYPLDYFKDFNK